MLPRTTGESISKYLNLDKLPGMCAKEPMTADGIIRQNRYIAGILLFTNRIHCQYARLVTQGYFAHFGRIVYVAIRKNNEKTKDDGSQKFLKDGIEFYIAHSRSNNYFRQPYDTIGRHWLFGTHTWQLIQIQIFADALSNLQSEKTMKKQKMMDRRNFLRTASSFTLLTVEA